MIQLVHKTQRVLFVIILFSINLFAQSKSLQFNSAGTNDIVKAVNFSQIGNIYTIEGWVKPTTNNGEQHLFELWDGLNGDQFYLSDGGYLNATAITNVSDAGYAARQVPANQWTHVAYVRSEDSIKIYKNGVRVMWGQVGGYGVQKTLVLAHFKEDGNSYGATAFKGFMDEVRVWSTARTKIEIADNKDAILDGTEPNLEALYTFENENGNTLTDQTPNNRNGVLYNMDNTAWNSDGVTMQWYSKDDGVKTYYVSTAGDDSPLRGTSETTPWRTIKYAAMRVINPGDYVYVKAGTYKNENLIINDGDAANQIVFEGYKSVPGDGGNIDWWTYDENQSNLDATKLPLLAGKDRKEGISVQLKPYTTFKNFQIKNYQTALLLYDATNCDIENIIAFAIGDSTLEAQPDGDGIKIRGSAYGIGNNTVKNCKIVNAHGYGISINYSSNNTIENCSVYSDDPYGTHYYIHIGSEDNTTMPANDNIVKDCFLQRKVGSTHHGHGVAIKGGHDFNNGDINGACKNNVVKNCTTKNFRGDAFAVRRSGAVNNNFINCIADAGTEPDASGFFARDGANNNTFENCKTVGCATAVSFWANGEDQNKPTTAYNNTFKNCIFSKTTGRQITFGDANYPQTTKDNSFINCVFDGGSYLYNAVKNSTNDSLVNCIVVNVNSYKSGGASLNIVYKNSDFYNNGFSTPAGDNMLSDNPLFLDLTNSDYHITSTSPCINAGTSDGISLSDTDYEGNPRVQGESVDIGAYESATAPNYALQFNGEATKDEFVEISSIPTSSVITIEFWAKQEGSSDDTDAMINMGGDGKRLTLKSSGHMPAWTDSWNAYASNGISLNEWHHIAYVANNGTLSALYIDGVSQTIEGGTSISMPTNTWYLASWYGGDVSSLNFVGCLDELRIWNDERTASEISSNKDTELTGNEQGLVGYWKFNEGSGTTLADSKGNANGTLYNMENSDWVTGPNLNGGNPPANTPPVANAGSDQTVTDNDNNGSENITLDGSASTDSDGTISSYVWKEGATQIATGVNPTVSLSVGTHTITLIVTDNDGASSNDDVIITINGNGGGGSTNYALQFNGEATKDEFVEITSIPTSSVMTIEFWVKAEGSSDDTDAMINMGGDSKRLTLKSSGHMPAWSDGWNAYASNGISLNEWHHIAYVANNGTLSALYIDGVSQTIEGGTSITMPTNTWYLASWYGGDVSSLNFVGCLDELRIWNDERTASEISSNKDTELTGNEQGLVGYWKFNEGSGTTLADSKGNANGTLYNMENSDWVSGPASLSKKWDVDNNQNIKIPNEFVLQQNYPNPFNPTTVINFALPVTQNVEVSVYNMLGEKVAELVNRNMNAGYHSVTFDATFLTSGIYIYRISAGNFSSVKKMLLLK